MKTLILCCVGAAALGLNALRPLQCLLAPCCEAPAHGQEGGGAIRGRYLEARSVTLFGGACHINGEFASQGRQALVAWALEGGTAGGVDLAGVRAVAAVSSPENLAALAGRRSVLYLDAPTSAQRREARRWLLRAQASVLGTVDSVVDAPIEIELVGDAFRLEVAGAATLAGTAIADPACCTMPDQRWYEPLAPGVEELRVGIARECSYRGTDELPAWAYDGANNVLVGAFRGAEGEPRSHGD